MGAETTTTATLPTLVARVAGENFRVEAQAIAAAEAANTADPGDAFTNTVAMMEFRTHDGPKVYVVPTPASAVNPRQWFGATIVAGHHPVKIDFGPNGLRTPKDGLRRAADIWPPPGGAIAGVPHNGTIFWHSNGEHFVVGQPEAIP
jgi:hypothetical protein